jgi:GNAT superfamily N-acetyltransferase
MTEQNISIREFQLTDLEELTDLTSQLGYATTVQQMTARMNDIMKHTNYWTFVALANDKVVGYIGLNKNYSWEQDGEHLRVQALVVDYSYRKLGVGKKLMDSAEQFARQNNIGVILLNCGNREERQAAHRFYASIGFNSKSTGYVKRLEKRK